MEIPRSKSLRLGFPAEIRHRFRLCYKAYMLDKPYYCMRDDRNAKIRRKWSGRINEHYVMSTGFRMLGLPWYYQLYALRPLIIGLLPSWLYDWLHKRK